MKTRDIYVKNTPLDQARKKWHEALTACSFYSMNKQEIIGVDDSLGRLTAEPVFAGHSSPSYNAAAMDGVAVRFLDLATASEAHPVHLEKESFQPVNTGNALPSQFDAVVMIEDVHYINEDRIELISPATPWQHVRTIGEDIVATELILPEGHKIRPIDLGAMLATGITKVKVKSSPEIVVIPTGSELIQPGEKVQPGQIIEFNSRVLAGYLDNWGARAHRGDPVNDDPALLEKNILAATEHCDIVILNAGASAGTKDFTASVLKNIGEVVVHGIAIKPGKPAILALVNGTPVIGLPGYPVSAILTMQLFVRDMINDFLSIERHASPTVQANMSRPVHSSMGVDQIVRVTLGHVGDNLMATPSGKGAGAVMSLVKADGLITIPSGSEGLGAGEQIEVELLRPEREIDATVVTIGSHDNILDLIANRLHRLKPVIRISSAHVGSMGGIMAIKRGEAHMAGTHLLDEQSGEYNISFIKRFLKDLPLQLINLCHREQGLIVAQGNPLKINSFETIRENKNSFINRQGGAGTRLLTDKLLRDKRIDPKEIQGYAHEEYTHMAVAAAVASGSVDCGMGIKAAAQALSLDFIPVAEERYDLIIPIEFIEDPKILALLQLLQDDKSFQEEILSLGGYNLRDCGKVVYQQ